MTDILLCFLFGVVVFVLACIKDELARIRQIMEEERDE